jgi:adenylosuccinate synthase
MPISIAVGTQWGDEGKGRVVDLLSEEAEIVARFNGGDNAGHTVTVGSQTFKLHLIPSGVVHPHTLCVLGSGMVINPLTFLAEQETLAATGVQTSPERLLISHTAHLITPAHRLLDQVKDEARGAGKIGTTGRGIGPAYVDKADRSGLRAQDLLTPEIFEQKLREHFGQVSTLIQALYHKEALDVDSMVKDYAPKALSLAPYVRDTGAYLRQALRQGKKILAEAAQGTLLDIDHGTYPFVTSSTTSAPGALSGLGLGLYPVEQVVGITKSFQTRVGSGPFTTEVQGEFATRLRGTGENPWDEFGTTTGRPRRVGWLDGVLLRYAVEINGVTELTMTKMDILSGLPELKICTAYTLHGKPYQDTPLGVLPGSMEHFQPVYETLPGWNEDLTRIQTWEALPSAAQAYIHRVEEIAGAPVRMISVGPERHQIIRH